MPPSVHERLHGVQQVCPPLSRKPWKRADRSSTSTVDAMTARAGRDNRTRGLCQRLYRRTGIVAANESLVTGDVELRQLQQKGHDGPHLVIATLRRPRGHTGV